MLNRNSPPKIVVLGSINMDLVVRCAKLPSPGQTVLAQSSHEFCGGKGANQAVAAALAGGDVCMIGAVGSDAFADRLLDNLTGHGIDCSAVARRADLASGLAVISVDAAGQNSIMVVPGANASVTRDDVLSAKTLIEQCDVLLLQLEIPIDAVLAGIEVDQQPGVRVVLDPAPAVDQLPARCLTVDLLCPNESEAAQLTGLPVESVEQALAAATALQQTGVKTVAITLGSQGTLLLGSGVVLDASGSQLIPAFPIQAVDTTAAGDAFAGALVVHWAEHNDLLAAVRFANAAGALAASGHGAQASMANRATIEVLLKSSRHE